MTLLNWRDRSHFSPDPEPCVICEKPAHMRSDRNKPVHKVCAEDWIDQHTPPADPATPSRR
jgi:hypothetical protein